MNAAGRDLSPALAYSLLAAAAAAHFYALWPYVGTAVHEFDAVHTYFPAAREFLAQGPAFFLQERSIHAPPLSYLYPALIGPSLGRVKLANALLSGLTLLLVFRAGWLLHSRAAGVMAAWLFAASPLLRPHLASPVTEGPYLFWCALWFWGFAEWIGQRRRWALAASAAGICFAALTRAPIFYWALLMVVVLAVAALRLRDRPDSRRGAVGLLLAYGVAMLPPLAFTAKNYVVFGLPFFTTGGGNALYLGNNPLTGGYDPTYVGLIYDVGAIARDQSHLTLEAERLLGGAARLILREKDAAFLARMHAQKLAAFVFVTGAEPGVLELRSWRIALLILAGVGLAATRVAVLRWTLLAMLVFQAAVHVPVLYTHRYSVGALDLWLTIAAGLGLAAVLQGSRRRAAVVTAFVILGIGLGFLAHARVARPMPDVAAVGRLLVWQSAPLQLDGPRATVDLAIEGTTWFRDFNNHVLVMDVENRGPCEQVSASFRPRGTEAWHAAAALRVPADGQMRRVQVGGAPLRLNEEGTLRLAAQCDGASLAVKRAAVYAALGAIDYRERLLGERPLLPVER